MARASVEDHFRAKPSSMVALYRKFASLVTSVGPVKVSLTRTPITFGGSRRLFAGAKLTGTSLTGFLDMQRVVDYPRITRASPHTKKVFTNHFRVTRPAELDGIFASWVREA